MSSISSVSSTANPLLTAIQPPGAAGQKPPIAPTTSPQPTTGSTPAAPVDSDGDHDGSGGGLNVKA